jgi:hypothetical protein
MLECAFHLDIHIECRNGTPIVDTMDHLPPLPLVLDYKTTGQTFLAEEDELGIYHALRLHDLVRHIHLNLPPSILCKVLVLMDQHFPILEHLSLSFPAKTSISTLTLPKAFLAPNLRYLALPSISPPKRLRFLTSTVSLVTLKLRNIETSGYFRPRLLVARLRSLPQLEKLSIGFSIPIPRPSTEREMLGEQGACVTLPSLKHLLFRGVSAHLESLVAQIRAPLLEELDITLFNQIAFVLPHLYHLINTTAGFKIPVAGIYFSHDGVSVTTGTAHHNSRWLDGPFCFRVKCKQLDWQIDCATQICNALIPALSRVEIFTLNCNFIKISTELDYGAIDSTMWHERLRSFIGVKELYIYNGLLEELSRALQVDEVGLEPEFLPNRQTITAEDDPFTSFIDTRQIVGRPVQFSRLPPSMPMST